jgi:hypothetical protein
MGPTSRLCDTTWGRQGIYIYTPPPQKDMQATAADTSPANLIKVATSSLHTSPLKTVAATHRAPSAAAGS